MARSLGTNLRGIVAVSLTALGCSPFLDSPDAEFKTEHAGDAPLGDLTQLTSSPTPVIDGWFGYNVSWGGNALAVTAPFETLQAESGPIEQGGAVYLFEPSGKAWKRTQLVMPNAGRWDGMITNDNGTPTIISAIRVALDARSVFVGVAAEDSSSPGNPSDDSMPESGALYVYDRERLDQPPLYVKAPVVTERSAFGFALALSDDWLIVSAPADDRATDGEVATEIGVVYAYPRNGSDLAEPQLLRAPNGQAGDRFGTAVALEGDTLFIAAPTEDGGSPGVDGAMHDESAENSGAVYVYRLVDDIWIPDHYLKPPAPESKMEFGVPLSVSDDCLAIGARLASCPGSPGISGSGQGAVYVHCRKEGVWEFEQCLGPDSGNHPVGFGFAISLQEDRLLVGALGDRSASLDPMNDSLQSAGAAYLFARNQPGHWARQSYLKAPEPAVEDYFGVSVAILPGYLAVGATEGLRPPAVPAEPGDDAPSGPGTVYLIPSEP